MSKLIMCFFPQEVKLKGKEQAKLSFLSFILDFVYSVKVQVFFYASHTQLYRI